ncbi:MAG: hypothetical protein QGI42_06710 [Rhodospirillales bacterium]|nr:hypothetical protein [Rhodospirillales bacterium]
MESPRLRDGRDVHAWVVMVFRNSIAEAHLDKTYPVLREAFDVLGPVNLPPRDGVPIGEAVTRIVIGQMLSRDAALSIYRRVTAARDERGLAGSWQLDEETLVSLGFSRRKARTIREFADRYQVAPASYERWRTLDYDTLCREVSAFWGMSAWSADMLAIFYFGQPDVFPIADGTIKRAVTLIEKQILGGRKFEPMRARPYRTFLSLYLWKAVDTGYLANRPTI